jgi:hypothetical protein
MTEVTEQTLASLEAKRRQLVEKMTELEAEHGKVALAFYTGDKVTGARLGQVRINVENFQNVLRSVELAIAEAKAIFIHHEAKHSGEELV